MDGMLSQDEINALLNGIDLPDDVSADDDDDSGEVISSSDGGGYSETNKENESGELLSEVDKDAIGEVANISMGSSATTLYSLVNRKVNITTPQVSVAKWESLLDEYERPCVFIQIKYTVGLDGTNILILKENDVKIITDLMMGGDGTNVDGELGELHLSAISEAMNQMMGSAATSLSTMLGTMIDISPPEASVLNLTEIASGNEVAPFLGGEFVKISFRMQIGDLVDSSIMQLYPIDFSRKLVDTFMSNQLGGMIQENNPTPIPESAAPNNTVQQAPVSDMTGSMGAGMDAQMNMGGQMGMNPQMDMSQMGMNPQMNMGQMGMNPQMNMGQMGMNPQMNMGQMGMNPQMGMPMGNYQMGMMPPQMMGNMQNVNVQPAQFQNFSTNLSSVPGQENINLIMDVPLEVTVELGRTSKSISEILDFAPGTIIELDRIAGEPIDVLVNGKFVAKGEVVVIEESFGIRVTEIIK